MKFILTYNLGKILNYITHSPTFDPDLISLPISLFTLKIRYGFIVPV